MDAKTLEALHGSIRKWIKIATGERPNRGARDCPLCQLYWGANDCQGCPVSKKTGLKYCRNTPYVMFRDAVKSDGGVTPVGSFACGPESTRQAEQMALFLIDLLPENERARYYE